MVPYRMSFSPRLVPSVYNCKAFTRAARASLTTPFRAERDAASRWLADYGDASMAANALLRNAKCDPVTGDVMNRDYEQRKRDEARRARQQARRKEWQYGKFGAASPVRRIEPGDANGEVSGPQGRPDRPPRLPIRRVR
jgi:hypothetical protein